ncbi:MAG: hypothetical protein KU37_03735 [Sulfuricurvum sp. PC08-66]|nr:MAG: hypothetical protein KU37_03735 [Sulfuricurvum sp. PC08-66]
MLSKRHFLTLFALAFTTLWGNTQLPKLLTRHDARKRIDEGWMHMHQSFHYYDYDWVEDMGYGTLRVIDDFEMLSMTGTPKHPHKNMEILSILLEGEIFHEDTMGNSGLLRAGEVQLMRAGRGIEHAETNPSRFHSAKGLQIWISPSQRDGAPSYASMALLPTLYANRLYTFVAPVASDGVMVIGQDAYVSRGAFDATRTLRYTRHSSGNGFYIFVIAGHIGVAGEVLDARDAVGLSGQESLSIEAHEGSDFLLLEIPMEGRF